MFFHPYTFLRSLTSFWSFPAYSSFATYQEESYYNGYHPTNFSEDHSVQIGSSSCPIAYY